MKKQVEQEGRRWNVGMAEDFAWIDHHTTVDLTITSGIPPQFEAYATIVDRDLEDGRVDGRFLCGWGALEAPFGSFASPRPPMGAWLTSEWASARAEAYLWQVQEQLVDTLTGFGSDRWWLGYIDTGSARLPFPDAPRVRNRLGWEYLLIEAGASEALSWRLGLPDLIFPDDHSWLVHQLWDDSWTCVGGPDDLILALQGVSLFETRRVQLGADATPPGHVAI